MAKKHEIKQLLSKTADEIEAMAAKSTDEGFKQEVFDVLKERFVELQKQLGRVEEAEQIARGLLVPASDADRYTPVAPPSAHKLYSKLKHFRDREVGGKTIKAIDQAYTAGMWFRAALFNHAESIEWCKGRGIPVTKAQGEGVDSAGGFLVPEELMASIIILREEFGVFRQVCQVVPMGSDTLNWPRRTGGLTAFFTGENQAATESQAAWDSINLTAKKLATLCRMSNEIAEDAIVAIADWLVAEIAYAFASKEDDCGFNGDGSASFGGTRGITVLATDGTHNASKFTAASGHNAFNLLTIADITGCMGTLPQYAIANAKWYISQQGFFQCIANLMAAAGGNRLDILSQGLEKRLLGFPVVISQKLPITAASQTTKAMFFFGDLAKAAMLGERRGVTIRRSTERYFENDQIGLLGTERIDVNVHDFGDNTNAGPLVAMVAP